MGKVIITRIAYLYREDQSSILHTTWEHQPVGKVIITRNCLPVQSGSKQHPTHYTRSLADNINLWERCRRQRLSRLTKGADWALALLTEIALPEEKLRQVAQVGEDNEGRGQHGAAAVVHHHLQLHVAPDVVRVLLHHLKRVASNTSTARTRCTLQLKVGTFAFKGTTNVCLFVSLLNV